MIDQHMHSHGPCEQPSSQRQSYTHKLRYNGRNMPLCKWHSLLKIFNQWPPCGQQWPLWHITTVWCSSQRPLNDCWWLILCTCTLSNKYLARKSQALWDNNIHIWRKTSIFIYVDSHEYAQLAQHYGLNNLSNAADNVLNQSRTAPYCSIPLSLHISEKVKMKLAFCLARVKINVWPD